MLFIHDNESQVIKGHITLEKGMGTDDNFGDTGQGGFEKGGAGYGLAIQDAVTAVEESDAILCMRKNLREAFEMLASQDFGRSEDGCLETILGGDEGRYGGHDGFA